MKSFEKKVFHVGLIIIILALGRSVKWPFNPTTFHWREKACLRQHHLQYTAQNPLVDKVS
jgi:hypothetical protein